MITMIMTTIMMTATVVTTAMGMLTATVTITTRRGTWARPSPSALD